MAKIIDYPRASLRAALQLAEAVDSFAGNCSIQLAAEKLGKKVSGAFQAQISAAVKYGLIDSKAGKLTITSLYRSFKLAYTPEESAQYLQNALLAPPLFASIYQKFKGQKLPITHFEKMLMREFEVPDDLASRVSSYFLDGAKLAGLLNSENALIGTGTADNTEPEEVIEETFKSDNVQGRNLSEESNPGASAPDSNLKQIALGEVNQAEDFWLNIRGPGVNFSIEIRDTDDLEIVQVMLKKITKALKSNNVEI